MKFILIYAPFYPFFHKIDIVILRMGDFMNIKENSTLYCMIFLFFFLLLFDMDYTTTDEKLFFSLIIFYILFSVEDYPNPIT